MHIGGLIRFSEDGRVDATAVAAFPGRGAYLATGGTAQCVVADDGIHRLVTLTIDFEPISVETAEPARADFVLVGGSDRPGEYAADVWWNGDLIGEGSIRNVPADSRGRGRRPPRARR